jgi:hypothetical protein
LPYAYLKIFLKLPMHRLWTYEIIPSTIYECSKLALGTPVTIPTLGMSISLDESYLKSLELKGKKLYPEHANTFNMFRWRGRPILSAFKSTHAQWTLYTVFVTQTKRVHPPAGLHVEEKAKRRPRRGEIWTANKTNIQISEDDRRKKGNMSSS